MRREAQARGILGKQKTRYPRSRSAAESHGKKLRPQVAVNVDLAEDDHGSSHTNGGLLYAHVRGGRCYVPQEENGSIRKRFNYDQVLERGGSGLGLELTYCKLHRRDTMHILVLRVDDSY